MQQLPSPAARCRPQINCAHVRLEQAFIIVADYPRWKSVIRKELDPNYVAPKPTLIEKILK